MPNKNTLPPLPIILGYGREGSMGKKQLLKLSAYVLCFGEYSMRRSCPSQAGLSASYLVSNQPLEIQITIKPTKQDLPNALCTTRASCAFPAQECAKCTYVFFF